MNDLLILGAGGYGRTVAEAAQELGAFGRIAFLDDRAQGKDILGPCASYKDYKENFMFAYPAFGANDLRADWICKLKEAGYIVPVLVHPRAFVSPSAKLESGTVVLAQAAVGTNTVVKSGVIVNMGAIADHDCVLEECVHLAPGAIVKAGNHIAARQKIESGTVVERGTAL